MSANISSDTDLRPTPPGERRRAPAAELSEADLAQFEKSLVFLDDLTGLYNRRFLTHLFEARWQELGGSRKTGSGGCLALVIIDLDLFKDVNDTYGHQAGDEVLRATAGLLRQHFRKRDFVVRYGGDEFVVVLPGADRAQAHKLAGRARRAMAAHRFVANASGEPIEIPVSFSIGAASHPPDGDRGEDVLAAADRRLYVDKQRRRDGSSRRRLGGVAAIASLLALVLFLSLQLARMEPPETGEPLPYDPARASTVEAELRERILELQSQLESLPVEHPPTRDVFSEYETRIQSLEATIVDLQTELERSREPPAPADVAPADVVPADVAPADESRDVEAPGEVSERVELSPTVAEPDAKQSAASAVPGPPAATVPEAGRPALGPATAAVTRPIAIESVYAPYPSAARRLRKEASVLVRVLVDTTGRAVEAEVVGQRAGFGFDEAAVKAAMRTRYQPGTRDGDAEDMVTLVTVRFRLQG